MKKIILGFVLALLGFSASAATKYYCQCDPGFTGSCVAGADANAGTTPATARQTLAKLSTDWSAGAAGDSFLMCQGGFWEAANTGQIQNLNSTRSNPVIIDSYDATSVWVGGAGVKPVLHNAGLATVLNFNKASVVYTEGYLVRNLSLQGNGVSIWGVLGQNSSNYVTFENMSFSGFANAGIQCNGGTTTTNSVIDSVSTGWNVRGSAFSSIDGNGILTACDNAVIENNTFSHVGTNSGFEHAIYLGSAAVGVFPQTITSITGTGTTATLTTAAPHKIATGAHFTITTTGQTCSGAGSFVVTAAVGTVTGPSTLTFPATCNGTAPAVGTYTAVRELLTKNFTVRGNTFADNNVGATGTCSASVIVVHGALTGLLIEYNTITETAPGTSGQCVGIEVDTGSYAAPEDFARMFGVVIRGNTTLNTALGIGVDQTAGALIENNYHFSTFSSNTQSGGIRMRAKISQALLSKELNPSAITIRYNTVYLASPSGAAQGGQGIVFGCNAADPCTGTGHSLYGNLIVFGSTATSGSQCIFTPVITADKFTVKDYNQCYYTSVGVPTWDGLGAETHSTLASTANVTTAQPFLTTPATSPAISTSSAAKNAGHPTLTPRLGWGGVLRNQGVSDIGAYEFGAASVAPTSPRLP